MPFTLVSEFKPNGTSQVFDLSEAVKQFQK